MLIFRVYANNPLRNYNYIIACEKSKDAVIIDPLAVEQCLDIANKNKLKITKIFNTHEHWDHIEGNDEIKKVTGAKICAHANCVGKISNIDYVLKEGDEINIGESIKVKCLDTPGHTFGHICFLVNYNNKTALFSGDTLFNAGAGNCYSGDVNSLYSSFTEKLNVLPDDTLVYPGHDYLENNLNFTLSIEPDNIKAQKLLNEIKNHSPEDRIVTTIGIEKEINTFFRLKYNMPNLGTTEKEVFIKLRELRNNW